MVRVRALSLNRSFAGPVDIALGWRRASPRDCDDVESSPPQTTKDYFTMQCLDASGVGHMTDFTLLDDKYQQGQGWNLFDISPCTNQAVVAFHPYKHVNSWQGCYKVATGINKPSDFVGCNSRWPGDACALNSTRHHETWDPQPSTGIVA